MSSIIEEIKEGQTSSGPPQTRRIRSVCEDARCSHSIQFFFLFCRPPQFNVNSKLRMTVAHIFILPSALGRRRLLGDRAARLCVCVWCGWRRMLAVIFKSHQYKSNASKMFSLHLKNIEYLWVDFHSPCSGSAMAFTFAQQHQTPNIEHCQSGTSTLAVTELIWKTLVLVLQPESTAYVIRALTHDGDGWGVHKKKQEARKKKEMKKRSWWMRERNRGGTRRKSIW